MKPGPGAAGDHSSGRWTWVDLRLAPVAAVVWLSGLAGPYLSPVLLAVCAGAATGLAVIAGRWASGSSRRGRRGVAGFVLLGVLAGSAVGTGAAAVRGAAREASPLRGLADSGQTAVVQLELDDDPHLLAGPAPGRVVADATVTAIVDDAAAQRLDADVLLFASGEGWTAILPGEPVRVRVDISTPRAGDAVVAVLTARGPPTPEGEVSWWQQAAGGLRNGLAASAERVLDSRPAGLLPGLAVGDTRGMDPVLVDEFRRAGLSHLTAVSGANVAILLTAVLWPLRRRAVDRRVQAVVAGLALLAFVVLARPSPSVVRAAAMGAVTLLALASGRPRAALPALGGAVTVLLLADPGLARDAGFALSVAATAAIVLLAPGWSRRLRQRGCAAVVADALAVSAAAGAATAPLIAGLSGTVSLVSLPANLLVAPTVAPATILGLTAALAGPFVPWLADLLVWLAGWPVRWLVVVAEHAAALPDGATGWPAGAGGAALLTALLLGTGWALWRYPRLRPLAVAALLGLVLLGWPLRQAVRGWPPDEAVLVACDVGQGDALVVPTGPGAAVLVDAGPDVGPVDRCLDRLGIDSLPLVLLSHLDADHVGGLAGALSGRDVGVVATGTLSPADERVGALERLVRRVGGERAVLVPGNRRTVGTAAIEVLAPARERATRSAAANDLSMVLRVVHRGVRVLLTGDLGAEAESRLLRTGVDLTADVLKVPHHGSADADADFMEASGARVAMISVGADNTYGHPAPRLLSMLARAGMRVHRTDREGDVAVVGSAGSWGIAARGVPAGGRAAPRLLPGPDADARPEVLHRSRRSPARGRKGRCRVTPCRGASRPRGADVPTAGGPRRGGAAALPRRGGRPCRGARAPPRRRVPRARRPRSPAGPAGRRARAVAVRRPPAGGGHRRPRGCRRARRRSGRLREGRRP
jgi:competence protein ComEC